MQFLWHSYSKDQVQAEAMASNDLLQKRENAQSSLYYEINDCIRGTSIISGEIQSWKLNAESDG